VVGDVVRDVVGLDGGPAGVEAGGGVAEPCCEWPGRFVVGVDDRT
jgi:hypothetical protein